MSKTAVLSVRMVGDAKNLQAAFTTATGGLDKWEERTKKAALGMSVASAGVLAFAKTAVYSASNLEQSVGAVDSVFKASADQMHAWAKSASEAVGLSQNEYNEFATVIGSQLKNLGIPMDQVGGKTNDLIGLGADLASMFGGTTADAVQALSAVFRGETDPIEKYGVSIKQSDVNARMAADGLDELEGAAKRQAEAETRLKLVFEQTADAQGNFAAESDTVQHKMQVATAKFEDAKATLGSALLPIVADITDKFSEFARILGENPQLVYTVGGAILGLTAALWTAWAAMKIWQTATAIANGVKVAWAFMSKAMVADNMAVEASSKGSALRSAAAWIANAARAAGAWVVMQVRAIGTFIATAASAVAQGAITAAAWVAAGVRAAASWVAMQVKALATFALIAAQAAVEAGKMALAWVVQNGRAAASFVLLNAQMLIVRGATMAMAVAQGVLNAVMAMNPIMLVVIAIAALVAALVLAYNKSETFRNIVQTVGDVASTVFNAVKDWVMGVVNTIGDLINKAGGIGGVFQSAMDAAKRAVDVLTAPLRWLINLISDVVSWIGRIKFPSPPGWMTSLFSGAVPDLEGVMPTDAIFRFMAPPAGLTAALAAPPPTLSGRAAKSLMLDMGSQSGDTITVNVNVRGAVITDDYQIADLVEDAIRKRHRGNGTRTAGDR